jgi:competence protein ComEA
MAFRLTTQERRIVVFLGIALIAGGAIRLLRSPGVHAPPAGRESTPWVEPEGPVNLNTGDSGDLQRLPGIGPALASRIIAYREENGPYGSIDQLTEVRGVGPGTVARVRNLATVDTSRVLDTDGAPGLDR